MPHFFYIIFIHAQVLANNSHQMLIYTLGKLFWFQLWICAKPKLLSILSGNYYRILLGSSWDIDLLSFVIGRWGILILSLISCAMLWIKENYKAFRYVFLQTYPRAIHSCNPTEFRMLALQCFCWWGLYTFPQEDQ